MRRRLGFALDLEACIGCKACQVACKDKHGLAPGVLWRRVVEVAGGGWKRRGATWHDASVTYFVSVSCMHCEKPICVEVCPTKAMTQGDDGIVFVDATRCMGCRYCAWACPYGAPQFDEAAGLMTKCDLCRDELDAGRDPACVAACPMRVLTVEMLDDDRRGDGTYPLPPADLTEPRTVLRPHRDVRPAAEGGASIGNEEEI